MNLFDATLDLANFAKGTETYTITGADPDNNKIVCSDLSGRVAEFGGGTLWFMSGASEGQFVRIKSGAAQTLTILDKAENGYAVGDRITIGSWLEFDTQKLVNAVNSVLRLYKIMKINSDLLYDPKTRFYPLPDPEIRDVRKVTIETNPWNYRSVCHFWNVEDGFLDLYEHNPRLYREGSPITLHYVAAHGEVTQEDTIDPQVDPLYLRFMSWLYLCRNLIQTVHKDNLVATDMYNEAKIYERDYGYLPSRNLQIKHITYPRW